MHYMLLFYGSRVSVLISQCVAGLLSLFYRSYVIVLISQCIAGPVSVC